tara:strand:- start:148 stop:333 length:186 start_codon:yes stop_codon:yes gene_type:complete
MNKIGYTNKTDEVASKVDDIIQLLLEKPDESWLKADIHDWLRVRNTPFTDSETKAELLEKV